MITLSVAINIFVAHFIADFVMQNDEMSLNKSKSNLHLLYHVLVYQAMLNVLLIPAFAALGFSQLAFSVFSVLSFSAHFVTDYWTSRLNKKLYDSFESKHWFFVGVGFDQCIHYITLFFLVVKLTPAN